MPEHLRHREHIGGQGRGCEFLPTVVYVMTRLRVTFRIESNVWHCPDLLQLNSASLPSSEVTTWSQSIDGG